MEEYRIFSIKDEFAKHYFYKSDILYRFFLAYFKNNNRVDLHSQFHYITNPFPSSVTIHQHIRSYLTNNSTVVSDNSKNGLEIYDETTKIRLHINEKQLKFDCATIQEAEKLLFPSLRLLQPFLFIINRTTGNFGWISPVSTTIKSNKEQVLYSYL